MESNYLAALPAVILPVVIGIFVWIYMRKDRQHAAEAGKTPTFSENCAGVVGWITYKGPFIRVAVYPEFLVVSCDRQYYLPFSQISQIERRSFMFNKGYRIHHNNSEYPKRIEVWVSGRDRFKAAIAGKMTLT